METSNSAKHSNMLNKNIIDYNIRTFAIPQFPHTEPIKLIKQLSLKGLIFLLPIGVGKLFKNLLNYSWRSFRCLHKGLLTFILIGKQILGSQALVKS